MAKFKLKKQSKRQPARLRYKIEKKVREHNRKIRKENKKKSNKAKNKIIQVPNICPFKEEILKNAEEVRKVEKQNRMKNYEAMVADAQKRLEVHEIEKIIENKATKGPRTPESFYKEFKKVVEKADVILEVVDARDPLGTRCNQVEQLVLSMEGKKLVLVLNKADLVPCEVINKWLNYFRKLIPTIIFKSSTQSQTHRLGQKQIYHKKLEEDVFKSSKCVGANLLMSLLSNYCRNANIKTSIRVGVVGLPNVGKSSLVNSLKRSKACNVGSVPGITKNVQEVQLNSKIKLLDSPGIVFASETQKDSCLRNAVRLSAIDDPIGVADEVLKRVPKQQLMSLYDVHDFNSPKEFYCLRATRMGRFRKGGVPDAKAAARSILEDWNCGKIKYYTLPPEDNDAEVHISSAIVSKDAKEFNLDEIYAMETEEEFKNLTDVEDVNMSVVIDTLTPVTIKTNN